MMLKKGQGISMTVIIVAAIALMVLVVLSIIFLGRIGIWSEKISACEQNGGVCVTNEEDCTGEYSRIISETCKDNKVCCLTIGGGG